MLAYPSESLRCIDIGDALASKNLTRLARGQFVIEHPHARLGYRRAG
jgi:hypothetical protein